MWLQNATAFVNVSISAEILLPEPRRQDVILAFSVLTVSISAEILLPEPQLNKIGKGRKLKMFQSLPRSCSLSHSPSMRNVVCFRYVSISAEILLPEPPIEFWRAQGYIFPCFNLCRDPAP